MGKLKSFEFTLPRINVKDTTPPTAKQKQRNLNRRGFRQHGKCKVTDQQIAEMKVLRHDKKLTYVEIGKIYNISARHAALLINEILRPTYTQQKV